MALFIGAFLALGVGLFGTLVGLDRERGFYATTMVVIALLYSLYAVIGGSTEALLVEAVIGALFVVAAAAGFRTSLWIVVAALAAHGLFDWFRGDAIVNPGVPAWWPEFCLTYDVVAAAYLAVLLKTKRVPARRPLA